jgi:hypothetical protein
MSRTAKSLFQKLKAEESAIVAEREYGSEQTMFVMEGEFYSFVTADGTITDCGHDAHSVVAAFLEDCTSDRYSYSLTDRADAIEQFTKHVMKQGGIDRRI